MICEPLELEYIAANVEPLGHEVKIIDMILEHKKVSHFINEYKPDVVGITGYIAHVNVIKNYAAEIKKCNNNIKIIVGGVHAEVNPEDFENENIDYIIRANGIRTFVEIINSLQNDGDTKIESVYSKDMPAPEKETCFNYLFPDRSKVDKYRKKYYYMFHRNCSLIKTSFGCPYNCKFCFCRKITDEKYFYRSLENIIDELKTIKEKEVYIVDDDFIVDRQRIFDFCDMLEKEKIDKRYLIYGRADFVANNPDVIKRFKECGLRAVIVGLESCDSKQLENYNKRTGVTINEEAVRILTENDVECYGTFITGLDWDKNDFKALGKWIKKLGIVFINLQPLTPLRGTELYEKYKDEFIIREDEFEKWDLAHLVVKPEKISVRKYYWYTMMLYYKIMVNFKSAIYMIRKYGIHDTLKLSISSMGVAFQYYKKVIGGK